LVEISQMGRRGNSAVGRDGKASIAIIHGTFHGLISESFMTGCVYKNSVVY
jgi:hypothetical protein